MSGAQQNRTGMSGRECLARWLHEWELFCQLETDAAVETGPARRAPPPGAREAAGPEAGQIWLLHLAAAGWIAAFGGFAVVYWPILARPRLAPRRPNGREGAP